MNDSYISGKVNQSEIDNLNKWLLDSFGKEFDTPRYRVVWSDDQFEHRWTTHTKEGLELLHPEVQELPKYKHYIRERYVLERLVEKPPNSVTDLTVNISYEPVWTFEDKHSQALYPKRNAIKLIVTTIEEHLRNPDSNYAKYKDTNEQERAEREKSINELEEALFGNEDPLVGDALATKNAVIKPELWTGDKEIK